MNAPIFLPAPTNVSPLLWTRFETSKRLNLSLRFVDALIADGRLKTTRIGRAVRISESALLEFIAACETST